MKTKLLLLLLLSQWCQAQNLCLRGKIRCMNPTPSTTKGAENIVVVPTFRPAKSTPTASYPSGYFEINTGLNIQRFQDKILVLQVISSCADCKESVRRVFISEDQLSTKKNQDKTYITIKDWMLKTTCAKSELSPRLADSITQVVIKQAGQDLDHMSYASVLSGTPALLNLLTTLTTVAASGGISNINLGSDSLGEGNIQYGDFLQASLMYHTANKGFNFSPHRDMSEAVFSNPSAMSFAKDPSNISLLTNFKNIGKGQGFMKISPSLSIGLGFLISKQDEYREATFAKGFSTRTEDSLPMTLIENVVQVSTAYKINSQLSIGLGLKFLTQHFNIPDSLYCDAQGKSLNKDRIIRHHKGDIDLSATYKISPSLQAGLNLMNLVGSRLYTDAFPSIAQQKPDKNIRGAGLGLLYKYRRLHTGADLLFSSQGFYDASIGFQYIPFNQILVSAGFTIKKLTYSLACKFKHFRIAYIHDGDYLINEKRVGKIELLQGKIYGGFVINIK